jgi:O-methyltransferase
MNSTSSNRTQADPYLDLLKRCLTADLYDESAWQVIQPKKLGAVDLRHPVKLVRDLVRNALFRLTHQTDFALVRRSPFKPELRAQGIDWPMFGYSMIGLRRLDNIQQCVADIVANNVPGDLIEAGVWRGGSTIFMRALLKHHQIANRVVWAADSFQGLPRPNLSVSGMPREQDFSHMGYLKVSLEQVQANFRRFDLLDDQVKFLKGWFKDTMLTAPIDRLALLRLDADMYESTMDVLGPLYPKVSAGGYVIIDDYHTWDGCRKAVDEFRAAHGITAELRQIDWASVYWQVPP